MLVDLDWPCFLERVDGFVQVRCTQSVRMGELCCCCTCCNTAFTCFSAAQGINNAEALCTLLMALKPISVVDPDKGVYKSLLSYLPESEAAPRQSHCPSDKVTVVCTAVREAVKRHSSNMDANTLKIVVTSYAR